MGGWDDGLFFIRGARLGGGGGSTWVVFFSLVVLLVYFLFFIILRCLWECTSVVADRTHHEDKRSDMMKSIIATVITDSTYGFWDIVYLRGLSSCSWMFIAAAQWTPDCLRVKVFFWSLGQIDHVGTMYICLAEISVNQQCMEGKIYSAKVNHIHRGIVLAALNEWLIVTWDPNLVFIPTLFVYMRNHSSQEFADSAGCNWTLRPNAQVIFTQSFDRKVIDIDLAEKHRT